MCMANAGVLVFSPIVEEKSCNSLESLLELKELKDTLDEFFNSIWINASGVPTDRGEREMKLLTDVLRYAVCRLQKVRDTQHG